MGIIQRARRRKIASQKLKEQGYKDILFIRKSKADALLNAHKAGIDISKMGRMTTVKEIEEKTRMKKNEKNPSLSKEPIKDFFQSIENKTVFIKKAPPEKKAIRKASI